MFAIVQLGNQQFKVKAGDFIRVPYQNISPGEEIEVPVLGFGDEDQFVFSAEQLKKSKVKAVLLRQSLSKKVLVFKKKRRKGYRRTKGHRQKVSELKVLELCSPGGKVSKVQLKKASDKKTSNKKTTEKKANSVKTSQSKVKKVSHVKTSQNKAKKTSNVKPNQTKAKKASGLKVPENKITKKRATKKKASNLKSKDKKVGEKKSSIKSAKSFVTKKSDTKK